MFSRSSESSIKIVRAIMILGWAGIISLCVMDFGQSRLTDGNDPIALNGLVGQSIELRGEILEPQSYNPAPRLFWGVAIPIVVLILIFIGHDTWRRICPMSTVSQIPRWLGWQRKTGKAEQRRIALVDQNSFLARYAIIIQFSLFMTAITLRLTVFSANPMALFYFTLSILVLALVIGFLFGGKSWCHYFCPMNPIQLVISGPRGLNAAPSTLPIGQSMCRKSGPQGDISNCVACNSPCPDVDMEKNYWDKLPSIQRRFVVYGYLGTVLGFVHGIFAATGFGDYGAAVWYDSDWLAIGFAPLGTMLPIPRILGSAILIISWVVFTFILGLIIEGLFYRFFKSRVSLDVAKELSRHRTMTIFTLIALLCLVYLVALPGMSWLPGLVVKALGFACTVAVAFWVHRTWNQSSARYKRESLAQSLRIRLQKLDLDWTSQLDGRQLSELSADEIYLLANLLPNLEKSNRLTFYEDFLSDAIQQDALNNIAGRSILAQLRESCEISDEQHNLLVKKLKNQFDVDDSLLISAKLRINSFKQALETLLFKSIAEGKPMLTAILENEREIEKFRQDYAITAEEESRVIKHISSESGSLKLAFTKLIEQLSELYAMQLNLNKQTAEYYLHNYLEKQARDVVIQALGLVEMLGETEDIQDMSRQLANTHERAINWVLENSSHEWDKRLPEFFLSNLHSMTLSKNKDNTAILIEDVLIRMQNIGDPYVSLVVCRAAQLRKFRWADEALNSAEKAIFGKFYTKTNESNSSSNLAMEITKSDGDIIHVENEIRAGRAPDNQWVIQLVDASRHHFRLFKKGRYFYCEDLNSSNGTILNNTIIKNKAVRLAEHNEIRISNDSILAEIHLSYAIGNDLNNQVDQFISLSNNTLLISLTEGEIAKLVSNAILINSDATNIPQSIIEPFIGFILEGQLEMQINGKTLTKYKAGDIVYFDTLLAEKGILFLNQIQVIMINWSLNDFKEITGTNPEFQAHIENIIRQKLQSRIIDLLGCSNKQYH